MCGRVVARPGHRPLVVATATNLPPLLGVMLAPLGVVFVLSARVQRLAASTAAPARRRLLGPDGRDDRLRTPRVQQGIGRSHIPHHGYVQWDGGVRHDDAAELAGVGQCLFMGLIGVVPASVVRIFWPSDGLPFVLSLSGYSGSRAWPPPTCSG